MMISYALNFEDVMLMRALGGIESGFYIDVGANHPTEYSVTRAFYDRGWRGVNVEPMPGPFALLSAERPRDINLPCALGAAAGTIRIWEPDVAGWATGRADIAAALAAEGHAGLHHEVPLRTLADICDRHAPRDVHFLKIDVEGLEKDVLAGGDFTRHRPWIAVVEATYPNSRRETHEEWESILLDADYQFVYADGLNRFYVAEERATLADAFRLPPNVFDGFKLHTQLRAEIAAAENAAAAHDRAEAARATEESLRQALERVQALTQCVAEAEQRVWRASIQAERADETLKAALERAQIAQKLAESAQDRAERAESDRRMADADRRQATATADQIGAELRGVAEKLRETRAWAEWAEERATTAETELTAARGDVAALRSSLSWRITAPLRRVRTLLGSPDPLDAIKAEATRRTLQLVADPAVKIRVAALARRLGVFEPLRALHRRLAAAAPPPVRQTGGSVGAPPELVAAPPRTRELYAQLDRAFRNQTGGDDAHSR